MIEWVSFGLLEMSCVLLVIYDLSGKRGRRLVGWNVLLLMLEIPIMCLLKCYQNGTGLLLTYVVLIVGIYLIYREPFLHCILYFMISFLYAGILELILHFPIMALPIGQDGNMLSSCVNIVALFLVIFLFHKRRWIPWSNIRQFIRQKQYLLCYLFAITSLALWMVKYRFWDVYHIPDFVSLLLVVLVPFLFLLGFLYMKKEIELRERSKYERPVMDILARIQQNQHQYDHHLNVIYGIIRHYQNYEELTAHLTEYMASIEGVDMCYGLVVDLEDPFLAGFLGVKLSQAAERKIEVEQEILVKEIQSGVPLPELVGLLGNILDNAMEEVTANELPAKIRLRIREDDGWYEIRVENPCRDTVPDQIHEFSRKGFSTKEGTGRRGFGLSSVADTVSRHRGSVFLTTKKEEGMDWFSIEIRIKKRCG